VVPPIESYGLGNSSNEDRILSQFDDKSYAFYFYQDKLAKPGADSTLKATSDDVLTSELRAIALESGFTAKSGNFGRPLLITQIFQPVTLSPAHASLYITYQNSAWASKVISMGDPSTLGDRVDSQSNKSNLKMLGGSILGAFIGGVTGYKLGGNTGMVAGTVVGSSIGLDVMNDYKAPFNMDAQKIVSDNPNLITFNRTPHMNFSGYQSVDIYAAKNFSESNSGEIIIAYKGEKTKQAEHEALLIALPALLSFKSSISEIKASRDEDYASRLALWNSHTSH
jgi:hypothetical protein